MWYTMTTVFSPAIARHVGPTCLHHWFSFDVVKWRGNKLWCGCLDHTTIPSLHPSNYSWGEPWTIFHRTDSASDRCAVLLLRERMAKSCNWQWQSVIAFCHPLTQEPAALTVLAAKCPRIALVITYLLITIIKHFETHEVDGPAFDAWALSVKRTLAVKRILLLGA